MSLPRGRGHQRVRSCGRAKKRGGASISGVLLSQDHTEIGVSQGICVTIAG
jgi:hypothetical protein